MESIFCIIPEDKRDKIINACHKAFGRAGYKKASTNEIIKIAGISKGLLFHYFSNKKTLFIELYTYTLDVIRIGIEENIDFSETDFFKRILAIAEVKIKLFRQHPDAYRFVASASIEKDEDVIDFIKENNKKTIDQSGYNTLRNIDYSCFREGIDPKMAIKTVMATLQDWGEEYLKKNQWNIIDEEIFNVFNEYQVFFKKCFYKDEYLK